MTNDVLQSLVDNLADRLRRSVVIDDSSFRLLVASRHFGDEDAVRIATVMNREVRTDVVERIVSAGVASWTRPGRVTVDIPGCLPRWCAPIRCRGELLGYLWLIDAGEGLSEPEADMAVDAAERAGIALYEDAHGRAVARPRHEDALRALVGGSPAARRRAVDELSADTVLGAPGMGFQVVVVHAVVTRDGAGSGKTTARADCDVALAAAVVDGLRAVPGERLLSVADEGCAWGVLVAPGGPPPGRAAAFARTAAARFAALTGQAAGVAVGVGPVVDRVDAIADGFERAQLAAHAAAVLPERDGFVRCEELGPYEVLLRIPREDLKSLARLPVMRALDAEDSRQVLAETLEVYLDNAGDVRRTAEALCVHRATLYHRLRRIESVTGCSLQNGDDRLALHLAVKIRALAGVLHPSPRHRGADTS